MADWMEIVVPGTAATVEDLAAAIVAEISYARSGVEVRHADVVYWVDVSESEEALEATRTLARSLVECGMGVELEGIAIRPAVPETEWRDAWKRHFKTVRLTRRVVVVPSWDTPEPIAGPGDLVIELDPGQAFGTGAHATTQLVLEALQDASDRGMQVGAVADLGCGSGILSIAIRGLWPAAHVLAIDTDPLAVAATRENLAANGEGDVAVMEGSAECLNGDHDLIVANIQAPILIELADYINGALAEGGTVLLSGILTSQVAAVAAEYRRRGMKLLKTTANSDWACLELRRE